jgi:BirA family biotin operon repressor/biotin-[acetyl-CoA-carboxylase] ligase
MYLFFMDNILHVDLTTSTNDDAYKLAVDGVGHGFGVIADKQIAGKGRLGKEWASPEGTGLYCSIIVRPKLSFADFPKLTLTAGLALCRAVEAIESNSSFGLKWPNDLFCNHRKCGGILVESSSISYQEKDSFVIVGIGLNVNTKLDQFQLKLQQKATSLHIISGEKYDLHDLYSKIHASLLDHIHAHETLGFSYIRKEWSKRDVLLGKEMQWLTVEKKVVTARGMGLDENGQLLAKDRNGKIYEILSGDVQLAK